MCFNFVGGESTHVMDPCVQNSKCPCTDKNTQVMDPSVQVPVYGYADGPTIRCHVATLVNKFGCFTCVAIGLCVATLVHKFGCLFTCEAIGFMWLYIKQNNHKMTNCTKIAPEMVFCMDEQSPDNKVRGANMGPIWGRQDPSGPHVGPMNFAIWVHTWTLTKASSILLCYDTIRPCAYGLSHDLWQ